MQRVYHYLCTHHWWRRVTKVGQIGLGGERYGLGIAHADQDVRVTFDVENTEFLVQDAQQTLPKRLLPKNLTPPAITDPSSA